MRSLQAQVEAWLQKRKGALRFVSCEGTATVETALALPLFLCAAVGLLMLGNLLLTEAKIQYALSRTADMYAVKMALDNVASNRNDDLTDARTKKTSMQDTAEDAADMLLTDGAALAKRVLAESKPYFKSKEEYLAAIDRLEMSKEAVRYNDDGTVTLDFCG